VITRCNVQPNIYLEDEDREQFLAVRSRVVARFHLLLHAYCLMDNQFHLLVETPNANLSKAMRQLKGVYTQAFNRRNQRVGHVLQGRSNAMLLGRDSYLLELCRCVVLTPVRAKRTRKAETYSWSSYRATAGLDPTPPYLIADWILVQLGRQRATAQRKCLGFAAEGIGLGSPWEEVQARYYSRASGLRNDWHLVYETNVWEMSFPDDNGLPPGSRCISWSAPGLWPTECDGMKPFMKFIGTMVIISRRSATLWGYTM